MTANIFSLESISAWQVSSNIYGWRINSGVLGDFWRTELTLKSGSVRNGESLTPGSCDLNPPWDWQFLKLEGACPAKKTPISLGVGFRAGGNSIFFYSKTLDGPTLGKKMYPGEYVFFWRAWFGAFKHFRRWCGMFKMRKSQPNLPFNHFKFKSVHLSGA